MLFVIAVLVFGSAALFLSTQNLNSASLSRQDTVALEMQQAKQALIAFAVNYADNYTDSTGDSGFGPGHLPCPDFNNSGSPGGGGCGPHRLGRLPVSWGVAGALFNKREEIYPFANQFPRRFWYVPAEDLRFCCSQDANSGAVAGIRVDDLDEIVAVIIDPGPPLAGQNRPSNNPVDYLEGGNEDNDGIFFTDGNGQFNDRILYIRRDDLMPLVEKRVLGYVQNKLVSYYNELDGSGVARGFLPYPADTTNSGGDCDPLTLTGRLPIGNCTMFSEDTTLQFASWFAGNGWNELIQYAPDASCVNGSGCDSNSIASSVSFL